MTERAHAKVNLVLRVGARGADGLHPLASLFASLDLADEIEIEAASRDEVVCPGVEGENLAARALAALRAAGADPPPLRVTIDKRIPVAAGLGGGSADAAAVLRAANARAAAPLGEGALADLALTLGSDVPSRLEAGHAVVSATGGRVEPVSLPRMALVLVPQAEGLSTADVYAEHDRLRPDPPEPDARDLYALAEGSVAEIAGALENDLQAAALSLRPGLAAALDELHAAGALGALISGSGPTAFGVYADRAAADRAAGQIAGSIVAGVRG